MMWVRFTADFDYTPSRFKRRTIAYKAGMRQLVKQECGLQAIAAGKAIELKGRDDPRENVDGEAEAPASSAAGEDKS